MDCGEFLRGLSDYRDGLVRDGAAVARYEAHRRACPRCDRLLAALDLGLSALRNRDDGPSADFRAALERRLRAEVAIGDPLMPTHAGLAAAFLMAAAVGLLLYEGLAHRGPDAAGAPRPPATELFANPAPALPDLGDVTLPAFTDSALEYHGQQAPLGTFAAQTD